jgi:hypothetical protein
MDSMHITQGSGLEGMLEEMGIRFVLSATVSVSVTLEYLVWISCHELTIKDTMFILLRAIRFAFIYVLHDKPRTQCIIAEVTVYQTLTQQSLLFAISSFAQRDAAIMMSSV